MLKENRDETVALLKSVPAGKYDHAYQRGKWNMKQVLQHLIDVERVFAYRALRFSRNDTTELNGFDQEHFIDEINLKKIEWDSLLSEWITVRESTILMFDHFTPEILYRVGRVGGFEFSVESIGFILVGHTLHHLSIIKDKYLG